MMSIMEIRQVDDLTCSVPMSYDVKIRYVFIPRFQSFLPSLDRISDVAIAHSILIVTIRVFLTSLAHP